VAGEEKEKVEPRRREREREERGKKRRGKGEKLKQGRRMAKASPANSQVTVAVSFVI